MRHRATPARNLGFALIACAAIVVGTAYVADSIAHGGQDSTPPAHTDGGSADASPVYGVTIPPGYRDWKLISVGHLKTDKVDQLRAQVGNDIAIKALREGTLPFPDGAMIAALHWNHSPSEQNNAVLGGPFPGAQSFVPSTAVNVQFMVKDSKKYATTGGWGYADFKNGKPGDEALHKTCFPCHAPAAAHDYVFAHYAPTP